MTSPFPFESLARPGKDAFDFWISFFPTAPLFGVEWRFAEMVGPMADPAMNPFMQAGQSPFMQSPFVMPFPGTTPAGAAARPGELDTPARAGEPKGRPVAKATALTVDAAKQATGVAAETGKAAARAAEATVKAGDTASGKPAREKTVADGTDETTMKSAEVATKGAQTGAKAASKTGDGAAAPGEADKRAEKNAEARAAVPETAKTAVKAAAPAVAQSAKAQPEAVEAAIAAGPRPKGLLSKRPDDADDLKMLKGVGPGLERQLNDLGVWKLEQLSKMSDADLAWVDANLTSFKGRCFRDDWVGQAKSRLKK